MKNLAPGQEISFNLPIAPAQKENLVTRLAQNDLVECTVNKLNCEFWDVPSQSWSTDGCTAELDQFGGVNCKCSHLTAFALVMRQENTGVATCALGGHSIVSLLFYLIVAAVALVQMGRTGTNSIPLCKDLIRIQHLTVVAVCLFRIVVIALSNAFFSAPGVLVLLFQLGTLLMVLVFGSQAVQWGKLGLFSMKQAAQEQLKQTSKVAMGLFSVVTLLFPILIMTAADRSDAADLARIGAYVMGGLTCIFAGVLCLFGFSLVKQLKAAAQSSAGGKSDNFSTLQRRLAMAVVVFTICFFLQGVFYVVSVQNNALADETAFDIIPVLFYLVDCIALGTLLLLLSRGISARQRLNKSASSANLGNSKASSGGSHGASSVGHGKDAVELTEADPNDATDTFGATAEGDDAVTV